MRRLSFWSWRLLLVTGLGAALRLLRIGEQILLDDEWHGPRFVLGRSLGAVWRDFDPLFNSSPPYNLYLALLQRSFGWSELALRLPVLVAGVATPPLLALALRRRVGERAALLFAFLLAVAPFLVFYARFCRAYAWVALLAPLSVLALAEFLRSGRPRYGVLHVLAATFAAWSHPAAIVPALAALATGTALWVRAHRRPGAEPLAVRARSLAAVVVAELALGALLLAPLLRERAALPLGRGELALSTGTEMLRFLGGTGGVASGILLAGLAAFGLRGLLARDRLSAGLVLATGSAAVLALIATRPYQSEHGMVALRYAMPVLPWFFLLAAVGLADALAALERLAARPARVRTVRALAAGLLAALVLLGPWRHTYLARNSFAHHAAYQGDYRPLRWDVSENRHLVKGAVVRAEEVPRFYREVAADARVASLVEYPFDVANANDLLWYYQHFHGKRVLVGYMRDPALAAHFSFEDHANTAVPLDAILAATPAGTKLRFANLVDVLDEAALRQSGASYLVVHRHIPTVLLAHVDGSERVQPLSYPAAQHVVERYEQAWGAPAYSDGEIVVFPIPPP